MCNPNERRKQYYVGYFNALQDIVRDVDEHVFDEMAETVHKLTKYAVMDVIRETEKEVKVPHDTP